MKNITAFTHQYPELLEQAAYGLAEWCGNKLKEANLIAVPLLSDGSTAGAETVD